MKHVFQLAALAVLVLGAAKASAQTAVFDFEDLTDQGFGTGFGNDASMNFPIVFIAGSNRMQVTRTGAFQEAAVGHGADFTPFYNTMLAASANEAGATISYDWYVDTSITPGGTFLQGGTYVNTGNGYYAQDFGAVKEFELGGTQLNTPGVYSGHVSINMAAVGFDMPLGQTFFRLGFILNGSGPTNVYFDNITVTATPEPATLSLLGLALPALALRRRRA